jgi:hypothetical protein
VVVVHRASFVVPADPSHRRLLLAGRFVVGALEGCRCREPVSALLRRGVELDDIAPAAVGVVVLGVSRR